VIGPAEVQASKDCAGKSHSSNDGVREWQRGVEPPSSTSRGELASTVGTLDQLRINPARPGAADALLPRTASSTLSSAGSPTPLAASVASVSSDDEDGILPPRKRKRNRRSGHAARGRAARTAARALASEEPRGRPRERSTASVLQKLRSKSGCRWYEEENVVLLAAGYEEQRNRRLVTKETLFARFSQKVETQRTPRAVWEQWVKLSRPI
jgi:hypothetical protein